ncbi:MAG: class I SAM-dependent methyltransferase [Gammaproteobacteria bacterium]|nr:class I SAM-dependent methyltransferase [Gammaproteobacteria bacterium]
MAGIDTSSTPAKNLQKQYPDYTFYCDNLSNKEPSSFSDEKVYDIVTAIGVLVHIIDDNDFKKELGNISNLIKPEGLILLTEYLCRDGAQESLYHEGT